MGDYHKLLNGIELDEIEKNIGVDSVPVVKDDSSHNEANFHTRIHVPESRNKFKINAPSKYLKAIEKYFYKGCWLFGYIIGATVVFIALIFAFVAIWYLFFGVVGILNQATDGFFGLFDVQDADKSIHHLMTIFELSE